MKFNWDEVIHNYIYTYDHVPAFNQYNVQLIESRRAGDRGTAQK